MDQVGEADVINRRKGYLFWEGRWYAPQRSCNYDVQASRVSLAGGLTSKP